MKTRIALITLALLLPVALAIMITRYSLPEMLAGGHQKTIALDDAPPRTIPDDLLEARKMAVARLEHLKTLSQKEWDEERRMIPHKYPPESIGAAVSRAELRVLDLTMMTQEEWPAEREKLMRRDQDRLAKRDE